MGQGKGNVLVRMGTPARGVPFISLVALYQMMERLQPSSQVQTMDEPLSA